MICRQFDVLYREGAESGRVMAIALHPYLTGVPHRIDAFDAALAGAIERHAGGRADLVLLAGFMRILTDGFVRRFAGRVETGRDGISDPAV